MYSIEVKNSDGAILTRLHARGPIRVRETNGVKVELYKDRGELTDLIKDSIEESQNDITCILDGMPNKVISDVCQVIVDKFKPLVGSN